MIDFYYVIKFAEVFIRIFLFTALILILKTFWSKYQKKNFKLSGSSKNTFWMQNETE